MDQIKLLSMTAMLTLLIWISADSLVNETVSLRVSIDPVAADSAQDMIVSPLSSHDVFELQITGPRRVVEDLQSRQRIQVEFPVSDRPTDTASIGIDRNRLKRDLTARWPEFGKVAVVAVIPNTMDVRVDHWVTRDVEIVLDRLTLAYDAPPQIPRTPVTVRMRESFLNQLPTRQRLQVSIGSDLERLLRERPAGESVSVQLTLNVNSFGPEAVLSPSTITLTATVKAERMTAEIPTVPILFAVSSANLERHYRPVSRDGEPLDVLTRTITVTGQTDAVSALVRGVTRARGIIHLKQDDLEELDVVKVMTPEFNLPEGIELAKQIAPVEFMLIDVSLTKSEG